MSELEKIEELINDLLRDSFNQDYDDERQSRAALMAHITAIRAERDAARAEALAEAAKAVCRKCAEGDGFTKEGTHWYGLDCDAAAIRALARDTGGEG